MCHDLIRSGNAASGTGNKEFKPHVAEVRTKVRQIAERSTGVALALKK